MVISELKERLSSLNESGMVRHECAEALGSIGTEECRQILVEFLKDKEVNFVIFLIFFEGPVSLVSKERNF